MNKGKEVFEILMRENADMLLAFLRASVRDSHAVDEMFQKRWSWLGEGWKTLTGNALLESGCAESRETSLLLIIDCSDPTGRL